MENDQDDLLTFPVRDYEHFKEFLEELLRMGIDSKFENNEWILSEAKEFFEKAEPNIRLFIQLLGGEKKFVVIIKSTH